MTKMNSLINRVLNIIKTRVYGVKWTALKKTRHTRGAFEFQILAPLVPVYVGLREMGLKYLNIELPIPVDLVGLYFSSFFFVLGVHVFDLACPEPIKNYPNIHEYMRSAIEYRDLVSQARVGTNNQDAVKAKVNAKDAAIYRAADQAKDTTAIMELEDEWHGANTRRAKFKILTLTLFAASFVCAGYLTFYDAPLKVFQAIAKTQ